MEVNKEFYEEMLSSINEKTELMIGRKLTESEIEVIRVSSTVAIIELYSRNKFLKIIKEV